MPRSRMSSIGSIRARAHSALASRFVPLLSLAAFLSLCPLAAHAQTARVSVSTSGAEGNQRSSAPVLSGDGRYIAFSSTATNLVPGDTNGLEDVFVRDLQNQVTTRVSVATGGAQATGGGSFSPAISGDGRYIAFVSNSATLVTGDTNGLADVFVHDRLTSTTTRVSVTSAGAQATGGYWGATFAPAMSADGMVVAFIGHYLNLVANDTNNAPDVFVHDRTTSTTTRASVSSSGQQGTGPQFPPYMAGAQVALSGDGRYVAFVSAHSNLVTPDPNGTTSDIFVRDRLTGTTTRVNESSDGQQADASSGGVSISDDGRFVAFATISGNLVPNDWGCLDVFVHDRDTHQIERVTVQTGGAPKSGFTDSARISGDGRFVVFFGTTSNIVAGDTNGAEDVFVHDRLAHVTERVNLASDGTQSAGGRQSWGNAAAINRDGTVVAFESTATNLVPGDTNGVEDVFVRALAPCAVSVTPSYAIVPASANEVHFGITTTPAGCAWTTSNRVDLLDDPVSWLTPGPGGVGDGTLTVAVAGNDGSGARHGKVMVRGTQITIAQSATPSPWCTLSIANVPTTVPGQGGSALFDVAASCWYTMTSLVPWLSAARVDGAQKARVTAERNPTNAPRAGVLLVADQAFTITQPVNACPATVSTTRVSLAAVSGSALVDVAGTNGCAWQVSKTASWVHVAGPGTGSGSATITADANASLSSRTTTVSIAGITLNVMQLGSTTGLPEWLPYLNAYRASAGVLPVTEVAAWSASDVLHSRYIVHTGSVAHEEDPLHPDYTAEGAAAGLNGNVAGHSSVNWTDTEAIDMWMAAPFHALAMVHPRLADVGFGAYHEGYRSYASAATLDVHRGVTREPGPGDYPVMWPGAGATVALTAYSGAENPDPLTACPGYTSSAGLPILLSLGASAPVPVVNASTLTGPAGPLAHCVITELTYVNPYYQATQDLGRAVLASQHSIILIPQAPLAFGQAYTVSVTVNGTVHTWSFNTGPLPGVSCAPAIGVGPSSTADRGGDSLFLDVVVPPGCDWSLGAVPSWVEPSKTSGRGRSTLSMWFSFNPGERRTAVLTVGGASATVTQLGTADVSDQDADGLPDAWEVQFGLDPASGAGDDGADGDPDGDGESNADEYTQLTHPRGVLKRYLAEGSTQGIFDTRIALANPGTESVTAWLRFMRPDGAPILTRLVALGPHQRATVIASQVSGLQGAAFATEIEADGLVAIDRTVSWDASGYGAHTETAVIAPSTTWYLAEGSTVGGFNLFYLLQNPGASTATVRVRYLLPSGAPLDKTYTLGPASRTNIWVNFEAFAGRGQALASTDVSAVIEVTNGPPIIVERALYLDVGTQLFGAGHESAGVTAPAGQWFLAEGATGPYFDLFVLIANPGASDATIEARYLLPDGTTFTTPHVVKANSRANIWVDYDDPRLDDTAVSTTITSTNGVPVIVERALWWPTYPWYEAHNSPGATTTGTAWVLAEGEVGGTRGVETYILLANTSSRPGSVKVTLLLEDGTTQEQTFTVAGNSRFNVDVRSEFPAALDRRFGALVEALGESPVQLVVERAMYWNAAGQWWAAGTNAAATRLR